MKIKLDLNETEQAAAYYALDAMIDNEHDKGHEAAYSGEWAVAAFETIKQAKGVRITFEIEELAALLTACGMFVGSENASEDPEANDASRLYDRLMAVTIDLSKQE